MPEIYNGQGEDVIDELVAITTAVTVGGSPVYEGRLEQWHVGNVYGMTDPDYGIWTDPSKAGTRFQVNELGGDVPPTDSDPGSGSPPDLTLDPASGIVRSTISQSVRARYIGLGKHVLAASAAAGEAPRTLDLPIKGGMKSGTTKDHYIEEMVEDVRLTKYQIVVPTGSMGPSATATLRLRDYLDGGSGESRDMTLNAGVSHTGWQAISPPLEIAAGSLLVVNGDGKNAQAPVIKVYHEPA